MKGPSPVGFKVGSRTLTFPYRDVSEYTCGLVDDTP